MGAVGGGGGGERPLSWGVLCGSYADAWLGFPGLDASEPRSGHAPGQPWALTAPSPDPTELESQTGRLSPTNASVPSGEQLRRTLAEVERLLQEMRARDLGLPRAAAEAELGEAQRREWCRPSRGRVRTQPGLRGCRPLG